MGSGCIHAGSENWYMESERTTSDRDLTSAHPTQLTQKSLISSAHSLDMAHGHRPR